MSQEFQSDHKAVVMNCTFPCKKEIKQVFKKNIKPNQCNIKSLKNDDEVVKSYYDSLDKALENQMFVMVLTS